MNLDSTKILMNKDIEIMKLKRKLAISNMKLNIFRQHIQEKSILNMNEVNALKKEIISLKEEIKEEIKKREMDEYNTYKQRISLLEEEVTKVVSSLDEKRETNFDGPIEKGDNKDIWEAFKKGDLNAIKYFCNLRSANINIKNEKYSDYTPLHYAVNFQNLKIIKYLIEKGANVNAKTQDGWTPLMLASRGGILEIVKILIENGADINAKSRNLYTPLIIACQEEHFEIVKYLIEKGAKVNAKTKYGISPLIQACQKKDFQIVKYLIEKGADVNAKTKNGDTPLSIAKDLLIVTYLRFRGAKEN